MTVRILGTRGEIESTRPWHSRHSGVLVNDKVLFDLGEREFLDRRPAAIFLTHLHPDHAFFARGGARRETQDFGVPTYAPETSPLVPSMRAIARTVRVAGLSVTPVPTHHSKAGKSCAYLIEAGKGRSRRRTLYTGDIIWINREYRRVLEGLDLVITEGSFLKKGGIIRRDPVTGLLWGHTGVPDLVAFFRKFTRRIVVTHFGEWFYDDMKVARRRLAALGNGVRVSAAYDGMVIDV